MGKAGKKMIAGAKEALAHSRAMSAVYHVLSGYPKYALSQMNDHLANDIVTAVKKALSADQ